ncbi:hypothetical protein [Sphingomonas sanguinis]|uniref:hypothetical protein n=1 Tax=Sphingomonas sanguinis TaxID=33051 RepID=UPI00077BF091|nr:hypothetical protein [Sphingomonas sanguinis]
MGMMKPQAFTYSLDEVCQRFGQTAESGIARTQRWQINFLDRLIATKGFPAPLPILSGGELTDTLKPKSRWNMAAVDHWFDDRQTPNVTAAEERSRRVQGERTMDDRAQRLGLSLVNGGRS